MVLRAIVFAIALLASSGAFAERKVALLIGNARYSTAASSLRNPLNDVAVMRKTLAGAQFEVDIVENGSLDQMSAALDRFEEKARGAEIGLIYYSGHGVEIGGENYLVPIDAELPSDRRVKYEAIAMADVLSRLDGVTKLKLVLLDACRDNPFLDTMKKLATKGIGSKGLARVETSGSNMLIGYATAPGEVARDGDGDNSPYAAALARHLVAPGLEIESALRAVTRDVREATGGGQTPFKTGSIYETVLLGPAITEQLDTPAYEKEQESGFSGQQALPVDPCRDAATHWGEVKSSEDKTLIGEHVRLFGDCAFVGLAKHRIAVLETKEANLALQQNEALAKKELQAELLRLNCEPGSLDGLWGRQSATALDRFLRAYGNHLGGVDRGNLSAVLSKARSIAPKACPAFCKADQRLVGGICQQVAHTRKIDRPAGKPTRKKEGSGGSIGFGSQGNCKIFNGQRICQTP
ncbi:caspase family protein [Shinella yambaruensis]|uniref:Caspase family p20 domain-containing protein n=1 Tax=Shinella yambaruensis TaxID=415996 RepID=A0ABQ5ZH24_9HYPH|nr:caspase family protein [Shinella yambaruensis]MCJ8028720.1 caspase family protein [Shinella yambaruensis]MCU7983969.1 caspase family protein [Shinella yambaruensis]GLR49912.1 hypothetical protein GCM10007923_11170 [Shinella yambaruensis]